MLKQRAYQSGHLLQRAQKADDQLPEMIGSLDGGLADFVMFQVIPHQFVRVEFGTVGRQRNFTWRTYETLFN